MKVELCEICIVCKEVFQNKRELKGLKPNKNAQ